MTTWILFQVTSLMVSVVAELMLLHCHLSSSCEAAAPLMVSHGNVYNQEVKHSAPVTVSSDVTLCLNT